MFSGIETVGEIVSILKQKNSHRPNLSFNLGKNSR